MKTDMLRNVESDVKPKDSNNIINIKHYTKMSHELSSAAQFYEGIKSK